MTVCRTARCKLAWGLTKAESVERTVKRSGSILESWWPFLNFWLALLPVAKWVRRGGFAMGFLLLLFFPLLAGWWLAAGVSAPRLDRAVPWNIMFISSRMQWQRLKFCRLFHTTCPPFAQSGRRTWNVWVITSMGLLLVNLILRLFSHYIMLACGLSVLVHYQQADASQTLAHQWPS